jgi:PAS domain S-box-containing protein
MSQKKNMKSAKKILVIEDSNSFQKQINSFLSLEGFKVYEADNGIDGLKLAEKYSPSLIVCDIIMPGIDGYEVLKRLKHNRVTSAIPFIFLTSKSCKEDIRYGMNIGADDYITKPFSINDFIETVNKVIEKHENIKKYYDSMTKEMLHHLLSSSTAVIYTCKSYDYSNFTYISDNIISLLGYSPSEFISKPSFWHEKIHRDDIGKVLFHPSSVKENGSSAREYRMLHIDGTYRWIYDKQKFFTDSNENITETVGSWLDITERKKSEDFINRWIVMEELVSNIATRFINSPDIEKDIKHSLKAIGSFLNADRGLIALYSEDGRRISRFYEWCEENKKSQSENFKEVSRKAFPWFNEQLASCKSINITSLNSIPFEGEKEKKFLSSFGVKSFLCIPLIYNNISTGFAGFFSEEQEKTWEDIDLRLIKITGDIFANLLFKNNFSARKSKKTEISLFYNIIGRSAPMKRVYSLIEDLSDMETTVLVTGETGTGKELAAEALHSRGLRRHKHLVKINCSGLSEHLQESELFGHIKGSFTGAIKDKTGLFQKAEGGTIFLDEIGDISNDLQMKLLRVLQEKEIKPVGSENTFKVDVRIIAATNQDLRKKVMNGTFREDLYYRLNVIEINLPPLRERKDDISILIDHFIRRFNGIMRKNIKDISKEVENIFQSYSWPGNVRELENAIEHAFIVSQDDIITIKDIPPYFLKKNGNEAYRNGNESERELIIKILKKNQWKIAKTSRILNMSRPTLYKKIKMYNIEES